MTFQIPNVADAGDAKQAQPDKVDFDILSAGSALSGVISGCAVTAQGSPNMTVAVAAGTVIVNGLIATVTAGNVTIAAADATNPRFDLVAVDNTGAKSRVAGTAAAAPVFPAIPANSVILAAVFVPANDTTINTNQIVDKRVAALSWPGGNGKLRSAQTWYYSLQGTIATTAIALNILTSTPMWLPAGITLDRIGIEVTTLGTSNTARLGIYRDAGGYPGALLLDAGTVSSATTGNKEITISQAIDVADLYWLTYVSQAGTACTVRAYSGTQPGWPTLSTWTTAPGSSLVVSPYTVSGVSGALPDPFGTPPLTNGGQNAPRVYVRVA